MSPLGQYGFTAAVMACLRCAAPYVAKAEPFVIPTSGGEVAYTIYNAGTDLSDIKLEFDGKEVPLNAASLVAARDGGTVLRVVMPSGRGTKHSVVIRRIQRGLAGKVRSHAIHQHSSGNILYWGCSPEALYFHASFVCAKLTKCRLGSLTASRSYRAHLLCARMAASSSSTEKTLEM